MRRTVGVAPGTITMRLGEPGKQLVVGNPWVSGQISLGTVDTRTHMRWDLIALIGGSSLIIALTAALVASGLAPVRG